MGGRGSFINADSGNFAFREGGQTYFAIGSIGDEIKVLERRGTSVKAPEISHSANRIYAIIQKGELKHIAFYNENHDQVKCIDFQHSHGEIKPHVHHDLYHKGVVTEMNDDEKNIFNLVSNWVQTYNLKEKNDGK